MDMSALHLIQRPVGLPKDTDFELRETANLDLQDGQIHVSNRYVSIDPAMRIWMSEQKSYWPPVALNDVMRAFTVGEVIASKNPKFSAGAMVSGMMGVATDYIGDGAGVRAFDASRLPDLTWALSIFGGTGLTAYFGLMEIGQPQAGETLVVSAAAGAVGSVVSQLGKALGMRVIGIAGGADKCAYLQSELGLDGVIDYKNERIGKRLTELAPEGVDVYFDNVGGEALDSVLKRLRQKARIVLCGGISQYNTTGPALGPANYLSLIAARARMEGFVVIDYMHRATEAISAMLPLVASGKMKNKVDVVDGIANFPAALRRVYEGKNFGKQLLKL
jgi:NADPH-dependent curcumin reductase